MQLASIDIQSRPLRLVYLVKNQADILDAVKLYTHVWGGFANAIFPIPSNDEELEKLKFALSSINPDFIYSSTQLNENLIEEIKPFSRVFGYLTNDRISEFAQGLNYGLLINNFPNIINLLLDKYSAPLPESNIIFGELDGKYSFNIALQGGILNENYNRFLKEHFNSKVLTHPNNIEQLIKISFLLANTNQPLNLTRFGISNSEGTGYWYTYYRWIKNRFALYIFCEDDTNIKVACDYWNSSIIGQSNKLFLPKQDFLDHLNDVIDTSFEVMPFLDTIFVTISLEKQEAINLAHNLQDILEKKCLCKAFYIRINYYDKIKKFLQKKYNWQLNTETKNKELSNILSNFAKALSDLTDKYQEVVTYDTIKKFLQKECNWQLNTKKRNKELSNILSNFVEKGLINRGYSANCPTCNLINFYSLEKVKEFNECQGCGESFLLPFDTHETITYQLNELALKLFETGGLPILMSINILSQIEWSNYFQLGGELTNEGEKHNFAEVDLFWLTEHCLTIVECKSIYENGDPENISDKTRQRINEACNQFEKLIKEVAPLVDAKVVVLSIVTNLSYSRIIEIIKINDLVNLGQENNIKVHLIVNWELYINGQNKVDLRTQRPHIIDQFFPDYYTMGELDTVKLEKHSKENYKSPIVKRNRIIDEEVLRKWREEIIKK
ncbi:hypothetical protein [Crocosphaera chwakensis]|uniref:Uncharacterized protein n=1 Tax=Crocosphaera chwakensis CCY0110 TaxID=391612 RepID=A3IUD0_9CHRO|nr:hypothetical protein [Crocosphaera chwakensis]EAZ89911.1 hypothetical protein CY0110_13983 [Crocosphaera chwakensis CCY0110]